ncbi:MAG: hypothetical protein L3J65_08555 [Robiginitomaculum sp.]|nr:hypothetical protein [Robiginitomaculum sp.]
MGDFIDDVIKSAGLVMHVAETNPDIYTCTITGTQNSEYSWQRTLNTKPGYGSPTIGNVLYHYALRAQEVNQYSDILEWSDESNRDLNDPKTIPDYKQLVQDKTDLRLLLGEPAYLSLMAGLEINQAIHNAGGH